MSAGWIKEERLKAERSFGQWEIMSTEKTRDSGNEDEQKELRHYKGRSEILRQLGKSQQPTQKGSKLAVLGIYCCITNYLKTQ